MQRVAKPRIFVNIASYRDPECQWTIKDLFEKAQDPDRISVGLCWQCIEEEDAHCFEIVTRPEQCREIRIDARQSKGVCWARNLVQSLWRGEEYTLQIDSHMRFVRDWDEKLLEMHAGLPSRRAVLSSLAPRYWPPDKLGPSNIRTMQPHYFDDQGLLLLLAPTTPETSAPATPQPNPFIAAGYLFGPGEINTEIPYDPYIYFMGEGITLAARLWTHGWDIFTPNRVILYHRAEREGRPLHWQDHPESRQQEQLTGRRVRHFFGMEASDDEEAIRDIGRYSLGTARSLEAYESFCGVDFRKRLIGGRTNDEIALIDPICRRLRNAQTFRKIWRSTWGKRLESRSGADATMAATKQIRGELPRLFESLEIATLTDAGCGDGHWIRHVSQALRLYRGVDVVEQIVAHARKSAPACEGHSFGLADITIDRLPAADAVLCRDVLTFLPNEQVSLALKLFKESGSRYLIATTYTGTENPPLPAGEWRPLCLTAPPFSLPPPLSTIADGSEGSKSLAVWAMADMPA